MKTTKKLFTFLLSLVLVCVFNVNAFASSSSTSKIYLCGIVDEDGADRTSWISTAGGAYKLYNPSTTVYGCTYFANGNLLKYLQTANYLTIQTHGCVSTTNTSYFSLKCVDSSGTETYLSRTHLSTFLNSTSLSNLNVCFLAACKSGDSNHNMAYDVYTYGASCSIGYTESVYTVCNSYFITAFNVYFATGNYSVSTSLFLADTVTFSKYGTGGYTDERVVYGDSSQTFE